MSLKNQMVVTDCNKNPVVTPPFLEPIIADPTVITPNKSPDKMWHLFAHGLFGIYHYISNNGINWTRHKKMIAILGVRPFIFIEKDIYYLLFEKISPYKFPYYNSDIQIISSTDLYNWTKPKRLVKPSLSWHKNKPSKGNIGNPCLIKINNKYRLYYSAGLEYFPECKFCEPRHVGIAESNNVYGPYVFKREPLKQPTPKFNYPNEIAGAIRVYKKTKVL